MNIRSLLVLIRGVSIRSLEKGETLIRDGDTSKEVFYIKKGLIRSYFTTEMGEEITFQLFPESHFFGNIHSILFNEPSNMSFEALERTKVYAIDQESFHKLVAQNPNVLDLNSMNFGKRILKQAYTRVEAFVLLSPEERYLKFMETYPTVINRAPDKYIAHVLGITPVSLSRIKGRIASKKGLL